MISRHLLRIKVFQTVYAYRKRDDGDFKMAYNELQSSIQKTYHLYLYSLQFLVELKQFADLRIEQIQARVIKDEAEWQKILPFAHNTALCQLEKNQELARIVRNEKISWSQNQDIVKEVFRYLIQTKEYTTLCVPNASYAQQKKILKFILHSIILKSESFFWFIEENSIFWNDDVDQIISMVYKTIHKFEEDKEQGGVLLEKYSDDEAKDFLETLFTKTLDNWDEYHGFIIDRLKNWDKERVAEIDLILLQIAIAEAIHCKEIPVRVTLNEYIELSKLYSTEKSNIFINGILHSLFDELQDKKIIVKTGRGLLQ